MLYFTSDSHYGHTAVINYSQRKVASVDEMDALLISNWNSRVTDKDTIYHLGDFSFYKIDKTLEILKQLKGNKYLVFGNHDKHLRKNRAFLEYFVATGDLLSVKVPDEEVEGGKQNIVLCHYAMKVWNKSHYGAWQLYGHSHGTMPDDPNSLQLDVGVDCWNYAPVSYEEIKAKMKLKTWKPVDGHGDE
jgi:calcineurin-like phosphoesterase family protein